MSIASEISRISGNIAAAYAACSDKGASLPQICNSANLASVICGLAVPDDTVIYDQRNAKASEYIANVTYDPADYTTSSISTYASASTPYRKDRPAGAAITIPADGTLTVYDGTGTVSYAVTAGDITIGNITPGSTGMYVLRDANDEIIAAGQRIPTGALRMIDAGGGTFNIRDLGGWSCDGGTLKYGLIFRGCELSGDNYNVDITADQIRFFTEFLHIRDEIDLRGNSEVDGDDDIYGTADDITTSVLGDAVDYIRQPISPYSVGVNLSNATQTSYYALLLKRIAADVVAGKPCYIHCMAGADRTGTLCALIEAICGVSQSDIDKDYELTSFASGNTRQRTGSEWTGFITYINSLTGSTFRDKVVNYALQAGVTIDEINALRGALIDGTPTALTSPFSNAAVNRTLAHVTTDNTDNTAALYQPYEAHIAVDSGYVITDVQITMGGTDISAAFKGTKTNLLRSVTKTLTDCTIDNSKTTVIDGEGYAATVTAASGYTLTGAAVSITMGGTDVSNYYSDGKITIPRVTGDLAITITAQSSAPQNLFDSTAATTNVRINSSGGTSSNTGSLVTDNITVTSSDKLRIVTDAAQSGSTYYATVALYASGGAWINSFGKSSGVWSWNDSTTYKDGVFDVSLTGASNVDSVRVCLYYGSDTTTYGNIQITKV